MALRAGTTPSRPLRNLCVLCGEWFCCYRRGQLPGTIGLAWQLDTEMIASEPLGGALADVDQFRSKASLMMYSPVIGSIFTFDQYTRITHNPVAVTMA